MANRRLYVRGNSEIVWKCMPANWTYTGHLKTQTDKHRRERLLRSSCRNFSVLKPRTFLILLRAESAVIDFMARRKDFEPLTPRFVVGALSAEPRAHLLRRIHQAFAQRAISYRQSPALKGIFPG